MWYEANNYYGQIEFTHECRFDELDCYFDEKNILGDIDVTYSIFKRFCKYDGKLVTRNKNTVENLRWVKPLSENAESDLKKFIKSNYKGFSEFKERKLKSKPEIERGYCIPILKEKFEELKDILSKEDFPKGEYGSNDILNLLKKNNFNKYIDKDGLSMRRLLINCWWVGFHEIDGEKKYSTVNILIK